MNEKVLFIDDEENILSSVKRLLRKEPYSVHVAHGGQAGLEFLKDNPDVSVIVSDMRMPEMDGVAFLKEAKKICPDAVTAILSGYADSEAIMDAVNEGDVWRYLKKPWEDNELKICIKNAIDMFVAERERRDLLVTLEEKVKERTWQLQTKTELLDMIIADRPIEEILNKGLEVLKTMTRAQAVGVAIAYQDLNVIQGECGDPSALEALSQKVLNSKTPLDQGQFSAIPLMKNDVVLGVLSMELLKPVSVDKVLKVVSGFSSTLLLALSQHKAINDAPDLMKNVDKLIDGLA